MKLKEIVILVFLMFMTNCLYAQDFLLKYDSITRKNLSAFIKDWENWSISVADSVQKYEYNDFVMSDFLRKIERNRNNKKSWEYRSKHFYYRTQAFVYGLLGRNHKYYDTSYMHKDGKVKYMVLPLSIYNTSYSLNRDSLRKLNGEKKKTYIIESGKFVPVIKNSKNVLYLNDSIENMLTKFVGGYWKDREREKIISINKKRLSMVRKFIPAIYGHWGGYWWFQSMPLVCGVIDYPEGLVVSYRNGWCTGSDSFFDNKQLREQNPKEIRISSWME